MSKNYALACKGVVYIFFLFIHFSAKYKEAQNKQVRILRIFFPCLVLYSFLSILLRFVIELDHRIPNFL